MPERSPPVVFISSTSEDLKPHRKAVRDAALAAGFHPRMMEYFPAGGNPPLDECLARVSGSRHEAPARLLIALVAHRYGWVPEGRDLSITWLECREAVEKGLDILAFLVDEKAEWPDKLKEEHRIAEAVTQGTAIPELLLAASRTKRKT